MKKELNQSKLMKRIEQSNVFDAIERLEYELTLYEQNETVKDFRYTLHREVNRLKRQANDLKFNLEDLIDKSKNWERLK